MKKKLPLLLVLPAMMLSSCGYGPEVTDESTKAELLSEIAEKSSKIKNLVMKMTSKQTAYDYDLKKNVSTDGTLIYSANSDGEMYMYTSATTSEGEKTEETVYSVMDKDKRSVLAVQEYNPETKKNETMFYGENEASLGVFLFLVPILLYSTYMNPETYVSSLTKDSTLATASLKLDGDIKYYSRGAGNLTIVAETSTTKEVKEDDGEQSIHEISTVTYDNYLISTVQIEDKTNKGNTNKSTITFNFPENLAIDLPSSWLAQMSK